MTTRFFELARLTMATVALAACATTDSRPETIDEGFLPFGTLQASVIAIADQSGLLDAVSHHNSVYIHDLASDTWYYKSGNYLLGIESFTKYSQRLDKWIEFGAGDKVAPAQARIVGHSPRGEGWQIPELAGGEWPAPVNSVWVIGTDNGKFGMGGAPQGIPLGTEVFGAMQTYGGALSTPYLFNDNSPGQDSTRIAGRVAIAPDTLLGGHSAGATAARRIALDVGIDHAWLYGTPNYPRDSGAYVKTETSNGHTMVAEIINNHDDPVTNVLSAPWNLLMLSSDTAKCHNYSGWDYQQTSPVSVVCP
jgi:hypothetical protein